MHLMRIQHIDTSKIDDIKTFVSNIASVSVNKDKSKNAEYRFNQLKTEAAMGTPSRPFEFYPVTLANDEILFSRDDYMDYESFRDDIEAFGFRHNGLQYTNARVFLKNGYDPEYLPRRHTEDFFIVRLKVPMFVWEQLMTHTRISKLSQSDRVSTEDEYWYPHDLEATMGIKDFKSELLDKYPQPVIQSMLKEAGYKREIYQRAPYYFKMKNFVMGGWAHDPYGWISLFLERGVFPCTRTWTQKETLYLVSNIFLIYRKLYYKKAKDLFDFLELGHIHKEDLRQYRQMLKQWGK